MERPLLLLQPGQGHRFAAQHVDQDVGVEQQQQRPHISVITWIEVLVGWREGEASRVHDWLESFPRLPLDGAISAATVQLRQRLGLRIPDATILATARCHGFSLATRNGGDFPLALGGVLHPYRLEVPR